MHGRKFQISILVPTSPLCSDLISHYKGEYDILLLLIMCIKDVRSHEEGITSHIDYY